MAGLADIRRLSLPIPNDDDELIAELVWSDPDPDVNSYVVSARGRGSIFGDRVLQHFLTQSNLKMMIRAHQCVKYGLESFIYELGITVFSSSNYTGKGNQGGFLHILSDGSILPFNLQPLVGLPTREQTMYEDVALLVEAAKPTIGAAGWVGKPRGMVHGTSNFVRRGACLSAHNLLKSGRRHSDLADRGRPSMSVIAAAEDNDAPISRLPLLEAA
jgi:hypothetical protein